MRSQVSMINHSVRIARFNTDVKAMAGSSFSRCSSRPACTASWRPRSLRSTSCHPVKRFSTFQTLCPWRTKISFPGTFSLLLAQGGGKHTVENDGQLPVVGHFGAQTDAPAAGALEHSTEFVDLCVGRRRDA